MAEIPGATVDFTDYSAPGTPRILNIPDSHGDVTAQDLWDTMSAIAADLDNLIYAKLLERPNFGGKGVLSATKQTGISLKTNNVRIKFEDLPGPAYTIKRVVDGNVIAQDHLAVDMEVMESSTFINWKNEADVSAAIVGVDSVSGFMRALGTDDTAGETAALALKDGALSMRLGTVLASPAPTESVFDASGFSSLEDDANHFKDRRFMFTDQGTAELQWQSQLILASVAQGSGVIRFTCAAFTAIPTAGDQGRII